MTTPEDPRIEAVEEAVALLMPITLIAGDAERILAAADAVDALRAALWGDLPAPTDDGVTRALRWLVELHDGPRDEEYEQYKPQAWRLARDVLTVPDALSLGVTLFNLT